MHPSSNGEITAKTSGPGGFWSLQERIVLNSQATGGSIYSPCTYKDLADNHVQHEDE